MTIFEKIKSMDIDELAEWLDKYGLYEYAPWDNWWDDTYCENCIPEVQYNDFLGKENRGYYECAWCELYDKCKYFQDMDEIPRGKHMIKMWLELEDDVDCDRSKGMYRAGIFEDYHFKDECWFDEYKEKEVKEKEIASPVKRFNNYNHEWWAGRCPKCNEIIGYNYCNGDKEGNRKMYCYKCGQLCDFEDV